MKFRSYHLAIAAVMVGCLATSGVASATQIQAISSDFLATSFTTLGGTYNLGVLGVNDNGDIVVEYVTSAQTVFSGGHVFLATSLFQDLSSGGIADGLFVGGSIALTDNAASALLTADIVSMEVKELTNYPDQLVGTGTFTVTGGSLAPDFGPVGKVVELAFALSPGGIENFTDGGGVGLSDVKLEIPEPATCLLFATAVLPALGWMRRRRATR